MRRLVLALLALYTCIGFSATSASRHASTWTFDTDYETGSFANGDPWVKENALGAGVTITAIDPAPTTDVDGRVINGSTINSMTNGFDSLPQVDGASYSAGLNVVSAGAAAFPFSVPANSALISSKSDLSFPYTPPDSQNRRAIITDASVLTVLPANVTPAAGDFRPAYVGSDKTIRYNVSDIRWDLLPSLAPPPSGTPALATSYAAIDQLWLIAKRSSDSRSIHPSNAMPEYGRDIATVVNDCLLRLLLDDAQVDKEPLMYALLQIAIDIRGGLEAGQVWEDLGGHNCGSKAPVLLAAQMFQDPELFAWVDSRQNSVWQMDRQVFRVAQGTVNARHVAHVASEEPGQGTAAEYANVEERDHMPATDGDGRRRDSYTAAMIGMPEWGEQATLQSSRNGSNWNVAYRGTAGPAEAGGVLFTILMGLEEQWGDPVTFEYYRYRYIPNELAQADGTLNEMTVFTGAMWTAYGDHLAVEPTWNDPKLRRGR